MSEATPAKGVTQIRVDANDEQVRLKAARMLKGLVEQFGVQETVAICLVATEQAFASILHSTTPMPEGNIAAVTELLDALRENVLAHTECARRLNGVGKKETVH